MEVDINKEYIPIFKLDNIYNKVHLNKLLIKDICIFLLDLYRASNVIDKGYSIYSKRQIGAINLI
jgi:hypothetical protein